MTNPVDTVAAAVSAAGASLVEARKISSGYSWPEIPRWHDGAFWFSDMYTATLKRLDDEGNATVVIDATARAAAVDVPITLGGFGWLPDGRLIVVSMHEQLVLVHGGGAPDDLAYFGTLRVCRAAWPHLLRAEAPRIVNTISQAMLGNPGMSHYGGSKGARSSV